ncbi:MAG: UMP kinase [Halobacteriaceae archaeon]
MKVAISVGGSVLVPDLDAGRVRAYADVVERLRNEGWEVGAVVGGGAVAREYIQTARELGTNEIRLDELGIAATRLNARLLIAALGEDAAPSPAESYEEAGAAIHRGDVAVMGGVTAGQTTDAVSAALAEYVDADLLVYATSVPGVFSADPNADPDAVRFDRLTAGELVDVVADIEMSAGSSAPIDLLAAKLIERSRVPAVVLDGSDPENVLDAVLEGTHDGTDVVPADDD